MRTIRRSSCATRTASPTRTSLDLRTALPTAAGTFIFTADYAYVQHFEQTSGGTTLDFAGNDAAIDTSFGAAFPCWKGNNNLRWSYGRVDAVLTYLFTGPCSLGPQALTGETGRAGSYEQINLHVSVAATSALRVYAVTDNVLDHAPPYDPLWLEFPTATPYDPRCTVIKAVTSRWASDTASSSLDE